MHRAAGVVTQSSPHGNCDHRAVRPVQQPVDDRSESHARATALAPTAHDHGEGVLGVPHDDDRTLRRATDGDDQGAGALRVVLGRYGYDESQT